MGDGLRNARAIPGGDDTRSGWVIQDGDQLLRLISVLGAREAKLSQTQAVIAELKLLGYQRKEIAVRLGRSLHTVDHHFKSIRRKLKHGSSAGLFAMSIAVLNRHRAQGTRPAPRSSGSGCVAVTTAPQDASTDPGDNAQNPSEIRADDDMTSGWVIRDGDHLLRLISALGAREAKLSRTEAVIAELKLLGYQRKEIAARLGRSYHTVDHHLKSIRRKLKDSCSTALLVKSIAVLNHRREQRTGRPRCHHPRERAGALAVES